MISLITYNNDNKVLIKCFIDELADIIADNLKKYKKTVKK